MNIKKHILKEMDDFDWVKHTNPHMDMNSKWLLINDVDPYSLKVSTDIQKYLFSLGYEWQIPTNENGGIYNYLFHGISNYNGLGKLFYHGTENHEQQSLNKAIDNNHFDEIFRWSQFTDNTMNESDDLQWMDDISTGIELQPNTIYGFTPNLEYDEIIGFANRITNADKIKNSLQVVMGKEAVPKYGITYFVTGSDLTDRWYGWCTNTSVDEAKEIYYTMDYVDVREELGV